MLLVPLFEFYCGATGGVDQKWTKWFHLQSKRTKGEIPFLGFLLAYAVYVNW